MQHARDLTVGGERHLDLGARADERVAVEREPVADVGIERCLAPLLLLAAIVDGHRREHRVPDDRAGRRGRQVDCAEGFGGSPERDLGRERLMALERGVVDAVECDRDLRVVVGRRFREAFDGLALIDGDRRDRQVPVPVDERHVTIPPVQLLRRNPEDLPQLPGLPLTDAGLHDPIHGHPALSACSH